MRGFCISSFIIILLVSASITIFGNSDITDDITVAVYDGGKITMSDYDLFKICYQRKFIPQNERAEDAMKSVIKDLVIYREWSKKADKSFLESEKYQSQYENIYRNLLFRELFNETVVKRVNITDDICKSEYEARKESYKTEEQFKIRHIFFDATRAVDDSEKEQVKAKAEKALEELKTGSDFVEVELKYSDAEFNVGKVLGPFTRGKINPVLENAALSLKQGQFSDIVETRHGYEIVMLDEHKESGYTPYDQLKDSIKQVLVGEESKRLQSEFMKELKEKCDKKIYLDKLENKDISPNEVIVSVNGDELTYNEVTNKFNRMGAANIWINSGTKEMEGLLEDYIILPILIEQDAVKRGLDKKQDITDILNIWKMGELAANYYENEVEKQLSLKEFSEDELKDFYESHKEITKLPKKIKIEEIFIPFNDRGYTNPADKRLAQRAIEDKAKNIIESIKNGMDFKKAEEKVLKGEGSTSDGKYDKVITRGKRDEKFDNIVFKLDEGELWIEPIMTDKGYYVVRVLEKYPDEYISFEQIRDNIKDALRNNEKEKIQEEMREELFKEINLEFK